MRLLLVILLLGSGAPAVADLYTCRKDGKIVYTSDPESSSGDCRLRKSYEPAATPDPAAAQPSQPSQPTAPAASGKENPPPKQKGQKAQTIYPTIPATTQRIRDQKRGEVLIYEWNMEVKRHQVTDKRLRDSDTDDLRLVSYLQNQLRIHSQNIKAIEQELARLGIHADYPGH